MSPFHPSVSKFLAQQTDAAKYKHPSLGDFPVSTRMPHCVPRQHLSGLTSPRSLRLGSSAISDTAVLHLDAGDTDQCSRRHVFG